jgi:hypothetical protein
MAVGARGGSVVKRLGVLGVAIALVALGAGAVAPALGAGGDDDGGRVIKVVATTTEEDFLDLGAKGQSLGDELVFTANMKKGDAEVGHDAVVCTITSVEREEFECVATAWFTGGQITVQGLVGGSESFDLPITGGSGKYEGAEGHVNVRGVSETKEILTFHLED